MLRKARKNHVCIGCGSEIKKGDVYCRRRHFDISRTEESKSPFVQEKLCKKCFDEEEKFFAISSLAFVFAKVLCTKQPHVFENVYENGGWMDQGDYVGTVCVNCGVKK